MDLDANLGSNEIGANFSKTLNISDIDADNGNIIAFCPCGININ